MNTKSREKIVATNRQASHEYFIGEKFECGIVLSGTEVKSLAINACSLKGAYIFVKDGEAFVAGMHISPYELGNIWNCEETRERKLLLHKSEIRKLDFVRKQSGQTIVPLRLYFSKGKAKLEIAICRGKHLYDKRQSAAKKDAARSIERAMKGKEQIDGKRSNEV